MKKHKHTADDTRHSILKAARTLFMAQGFSATSMSQLAEEAHVNQSLISHHFNNKRGLWESVKEDIVGTNAYMQALNPTPKSLRDFLEEAIQSRLKVYEKNPDLYRLVSWDRLEKTDTTPMSDVSNHPFVKNWFKPIEYLIAKGKIKKSLPTELVFTWILTSINGIIMDELHYFKKNAKFKALYVQMILEGLLKGLES